MSRSRKTVAFTLSMPHVGSWNGKWSGEGKLYALVERLDAETADRVLSRSSYYYDFGDGWGASVSVREVDSKEARGLRAKSSGFCGYEWMVRSIIQKGKIEP